MRTPKQQARFAGVLYLLMIAVGLPGLVLIPSQLIVPGDAAATAEHLRASATLFRLAIASEIAYQVLFLFLGLALYRLFAPVNRGRALALLALVAVSVPITFVGAVHEIGALVVAGAPPFLASWGEAQRDGLAFLLLRLHGEGIGVVWVFWALWLVPFGLLVLQSGYAPRIFGVLLLVAAAGDLVRAAANLFPGGPVAALEPIGSLLGKGELPIVLWLLIRGANQPPAAALVPGPPAT